MIDIAALLQPRITDPEGLTEFIDDLADQVPRIERDIARLKREPEDRALVADLFRALHTIKGDAALCRVDVGVAIAHPLESLLDRLRSHLLVFSDLLAETFLLALDRLELAVEAIAGRRSLEGLKLVELVTGLEKLAAAPAEAVDDLAVEVVEAVTGFRPAEAMVQLRPGASAAGRSAAQRAVDLRFFRTLAGQLETRSPHLRGRSGRVLRLAQETNAAAGKPVDSAQLEAAVYIHDIGMMFLPESLWLKTDKLTDEDRLAMHHHPAWAAGMLGRMPGWSGAAEMVAQHHEMPDGGGYPGGLKGEAICPGAKILAIVDAFEAVTLKHAERGHGRSLLRAIAEINACDNQFAPEWIGHFNDVMRQTIEH
jgi:HD-GYP domain-containing protein (c-di-GMP phosphodiesterase class II)